MTAAIDLCRPLTNSVIIEVTSKCNLRCAYCAKADDVYEAVPANNTDMSDAALDDLYNFCKSSGVRNVSLSGVGETAMTAGWHKRLTKFIDDPDIDVSLVSNLVRPLTDDDLDAMTKLHTIQVSFDSAEIEMVRRLRSKADLRTITYNIIRLRQRARALHSNLLIMVNCTLCRTNVGHIEKLAGFCRELGVDRLLVGAVMLLTKNNEKMPEGLDALTNDEVTMLATQIIAAEGALEGGDTTLDLQDELRTRIGPVVESVRAGEKSGHFADVFHRRMKTSACHQPWTSPLVRASGAVYPCCIVGDTAAPVGDLGKQSMSEIIDSSAYREVRASILAGTPTVPCDGCTLAREGTFEEFAAEIRARHGDTAAATPVEVQVDRVPWPGLFGHFDYAVEVENASVEIAEGTASITESGAKGLHRLLLDLPDHGDQSSALFAVKPSIRRRFRFDLVDRQGEVLGRARFVLTAQPRATSEIGGLAVSVSKTVHGWFECAIAIPAGCAVSRAILSLMREDDAVVYPGDGRLGLVITEPKLSSRPSDRDADREESRLGAAV